MLDHVKNLFAIAGACIGLGSVAVAYGERRGQESVAVELRVHMATEEVQRKNIDAKLEEIKTAVKELKDAP